MSNFTAKFGTKNSKIGSLLKLGTIATSGGVNLNQTINQTILLSQSVTRVSKLNLSVLQTLSLTEATTEGNQLVTYGTSNLNLVQSFLVNQIASKSLRQTLSFNQQVVGADTVKNLTTNNSLSFTQSITARRIINTSITQNLNLAQNDQGIDTKPTSSSITFTELVNEFIIHNYSIVQPIVLSQLTLENANLTKIVNQNLTLNQSVVEFKQIPGVFTALLGTAASELRYILLGNANTGNPIPVFLDSYGTNKLNIFQNLVVILAISSFANNNLALQQHLVYGIISNKTINQTLIFNQQVRGKVPTANTLTGRLGKPESQLSNFQFGTAYESGEGINYVLPANNNLILKSIGDVSITYGPSGPTAYTAQLGILKSKLSHIELGKPQFGSTASVPPGSIYHFSIRQDLILSQGISKIVNWTKTGTNTLIFNQFSFDRLHLTFFNQISFNQTLTSLNIYNTLGINNLIFNQHITTPFKRNVFDILSFNQNIDVLHVKFVTVTNRLNLTGQLVLSRGLTQLLNHNLILVQDIKRNIIINRNISDILLFKPFTIKELPLQGGIIYEIPIADVIIANPAQCTCLLEISENGSIIILPCPELGDTITNQNSVIIKKSINNKPYVYVKNNELKKLVYNFDLPLIKSLELRQFIQKNNSRVITLTNWKNEVWKVNLINNPIDMVSKNRYDNQIERVDVTLEFIGIKIRG